MIVKMDLMNMNRNIMTTIVTLYHLQHHHSFMKKTTTATMTMIALLEISSFETKTQKKHFLKL